MSIQICVPCDSAALALGADEVAAALQQQAAARGVSIDVLRNSSRGLFWLEPLVEVQTAQGRVAYGPVTPDDVAAAKQVAEKKLEEQLQPAKKQRQSKRTIGSAEDFHQHRKKAKQNPRR